MGSEVLYGFAPILGARPHTLILGNMPSVMSLEAHQYYGNPRNAFWRIAADIFGFGADAPYEQRCAALTDHGFAVWDVLRSCRREGSLDSAVKPESMVANDFQRFFDEHPTIALVLFNGAAAEKNYIRLGSVAKDLRYRRLPSTSPAQTMPFVEKLAIWRTALSEAMV
ncbi:DNA-deoxyinosine glycosylase [Mycobacterium sp. IS-1590]|uniref:DNA-deoxyinosine glycosylase n=1 Tax=Mycobacterium sp. IS-1590 TaxID=1772286 RepID=UPI000746B919|nr:DNA-deoxyinosine glycosylase [Mycobacterium sp. IS-1590]KUI43150.1 DNA-deoxyinosine glycosylase [Mycobacterium sp. IS-1590]